MTNTVKVKLRKQRRPVSAAAEAIEVAIDDKVMIETEDGALLGTVISTVPSEHRCCKVKAKVLRKAGDDDFRQEDLNVRMEGDYFQVCKKKILKHDLPMKLVDVEIAPDGSKVVFYFVAENRVDFRSLVKELAGDLRTRIEMRQIGARTEAQRTGGVGCCGRELCCTGFLDKFAPVTVRMTKEQGLPLDPEKISGVCGRLMCCLAYEYDTYVRLKKGLPKIGKKIKHPQGVGKVKQVNIITNKIVVELEDGTFVDMSTEDYSPDMMVRNKPQQPSKPKK
ncbi:MAG: stage 0 sporulation protein [Deltaproteobacteria bacterium]|nr:stage 0 sporulation protein [Deltaproteobacteria bacterium]